VSKIRIYSAKAALQQRDVDRCLCNGSNSFLLIYYWICQALWQSRRRCRG